MVKLRTTKHIPNCTSTHVSDFDQKHYIWFLDYFIFDTKQQITFIFWPIVVKLSTSSSSKMLTMASKKKMQMAADAKIDLKKQKYLMG